MKWVADESVDFSIVAQLRQEGHQVWYVAEMGPGIPDTMVLDHANREKAILITTDKDFGELVFRQHLLTSGVILLRLAGLPSLLKAQLVASFITTHVDELMQAFTVITPKSVRIRRTQAQFQ